MSEPDTDTAADLAPGGISIRWIIPDFWLEIEHDGQITWEKMQEIKNDMFGAEVTCAELFPAQSEVINSGNFRHLWRLPGMGGLLK